MVKLNLNETVKRMYNEGLEDENFVMNATKETLGGECYKATKKEDTKDHIDFWWESPKKGKLGIDVKGVKKNKRDDVEKDDSIHWVELQNVAGNLGWLYGKSDYIAFRTNSNIIFVKLNDLQQYTNDKIKGKQLVFNNPKECYIPYQRYGRKDMICKVPTSDLLEIGEFVINC